MDKTIKKFQEEIKILQDEKDLRYHLHRINGNYLFSNLKKLVREGSEKIVLYSRLFFSQKNLKKIISALEHDKKINMDNLISPLTRIEKSILKRLNFLSRYEKNKPFYNKIINDLMLVIYQLNDSIRTEINNLSKSEEIKNLPDKLYFKDSVLAKRNNSGFFNFIKILDETEIMEINQDENIFKVGFKTNFDKLAKELDRKIRIDTHDLNPNGSAPSAIGQKQKNRAFTQNWR